MTSDLLGFHGAISAGDNTNATEADFSTYMDSSGRFFFKNGSNSLSWDGTAFVANDSSAYIGLTTNGDDTALGDGSSGSGRQGFFAGATNNTGANATIAFGSDGKIRGTGVYIRKEGSITKEWSIEQSRIFGDGKDGTTYIKKYASGYIMGPCNSQSDTALANDVGTSSGEGVAFTPGAGIGSYTYGENDLLFTVQSSGSIITHYLRMERDVYLEKLIIQMGSDSGSIEIQTNGYRLFIRDGIYFENAGGQSAFGGTKYVYFMNRGENASNGGNGVAGQTGSGGYGSGNSGGAGGSGGKTGTLVGGQDGKTGATGGNGGSGAAGNVGNGSSGGDGVNGSNASSNTLYGYTGRASGSGGTGTQGNTSTAGSGGTVAGGGTGGTSAQAGTKIQHADPHLLTTFRDIYSSSD